MIPHPARRKLLDEARILSLCDERRTCFNIARAIGENTKVLRRTLRKLVAAKLLKAEFVGVRTYYRT